VASVPLAEVAPQDEVIAAHIRQETGKEVSVVPYIYVLIGRGALNAAKGIHHLMQRSKPCDMGITVGGDQKRGAYIAMYSSALAGTRLELAAEFWRQQTNIELDFIESPYHLPADGPITSHDPLTRLRREPMLFLNPALRKANALGG
jgi:hypothetical protein